MTDETEVIFHRDINDDESAKVRHHDNDDSWVVESYNPKVTRRMIELGAPVVASVIDGHIFQVDARQLIEFIAASSGLIIEFRKHKRRQYSSETKAKLAERLRVMRQQQTV
jgi:hypothetical protein